MNHYEEIMLIRDSYTHLFKPVRTRYEEQINPHFDIYAKESAALIREMKARRATLKKEQDEREEVILTAYNNATKQYADDYKEAAEPIIAAMEKEIAELKKR